MKFTTLSHGYFMRSMALLFCLASTVAVCSAKEVKFSYSNPKDEVYTIGTAKAEVYDVAIMLNDPALKGSKIVGIELPMPTVSDITDYSAWISKELTLQPDEQGKKHNAPDYCSVSATCANDILSARFDNPYTIGSDPVYVGYSFKVTAVGSSDTDFTRYPVTVNAGKQEGTLFLHTERHYRTWADRSADLGGISTMRVILEGDFADNSASIAPVRDVKCQQDQISITIPLMLRSYGALPISSLDLTYTYQGKTKKAHVDYNTPLTPLFGQDTVIEFAIPNEFDIATEPITITLDKINGEANNNEFKSTEFNLSVLRLFPTKRPVVEEYTGLWCGWCPRGYVGMETMAKEQPEFIGIAYHNRDDMQTVSEYPSYVSGYPSCFIDRSGNYLSPSVSVLRENWGLRAEEYTPVEMNVVAWRDPANTSDICAKATFRFVEQPENPCLVSYVLIANGLQDESWGQTNYFYNQYEKYMDEFYQAKNPYYGLTFNDVCVMNSPWEGESGSVPQPAKIEPYKAMEHRYTFHTSGVKSASGYDLIGAAGDNLEVVALMTDTKTGKILNAAKTGINLTGLSTVSADAKRVAAEIYYDLNGVAHTQPARGLYIKKVIYEDGTFTTEKLMIK